MQCLQARYKDEYRRNTTSGASSVRFSLFVIGICSVGQLSPRNTLPFSGNHSFCTHYSIALFLVIHMKLDNVFFNPIMYIKFNNTVELIYKI